MRQVTTERLEKAFELLDRHQERVTGRDRRIIHVAMEILIGRQAGKAQDPSIKKKIDLEMILEGMDTAELDTGILFERLTRNSKKFCSRKETIQRIQIKNNISGLIKGETRIGNGIITHWEPRCDDFLIVDSDLPLLQSERDRLFQFWSDHVEMNALNIFVQERDEWEPSHLSSIKQKLSLFDWADAWEDCSFCATDYSAVTDLNGNLVGYQYAESDHPTQGHEKHHELHLLLGRGKEWDKPIHSMSVCATNQDEPST